MNQFVPCLTRQWRGLELTAIRLGDPLVDEYLSLVAARARTNTWLAVASDLKIFFAVVGKPPAAVSAADVFGFFSTQRAPRRGERVVHLDDGETGLAARTIARRLSSVRGLYAYLTVRGDTGVDRNPVPSSLAARRPSGRRGRVACRWSGPRARSPECWLRGRSTRCSAMRTYRDRAMVEAMVLGGLRRCELLGLRLEDLNAGERRLFLADGKGGRQRIVRVSGGFFASLGAYLELGRPTTSPTERVFLVLKGAQGCSRCSPRAAAVGCPGGRDPRRCAWTGRVGAGDVSPAAAHVFHPAASARNCI